VSISDTASIKPPEEGRPVVRRSSAASRSSTVAEAKVVPVSKIDLDQW
jgi:hypothetical protein